MPWCKTNPWKAQSVFSVENALATAPKEQSNTLSAAGQGIQQLRRINTLELSFLLRK
jgi:hypothetical protein